jgi:uroporphyrinogen III methyltransferase / synthase
VSGAADIPRSPDAPLAGRTIIVTRTRAQAHSLTEPLEALGADVLTMPVLELADPPDLSVVDGAVRRLKTFEWVVFTSTNAVDRFLARPGVGDPAAEALSGIKLAAIGIATAQRMRERGLEPDLVPSEARGEGLVEAFRELGVGAGSRILIPRALRAREVLPDELSEMGADVHVAPVYQTVAVPADPAVLERLREGTVDCVSFTSGAIARAFFSAVEEAGMDPHEVMGGVAIASVGPVTTGKLAALGFGADIEATQATMAALADAVAAFDGWEPV